MPPLSNWEWFFTTNGVSLDTDAWRRGWRHSRIIQESSRIPELERRFMGKLVRTGTEARIKTGIVERVCKHGDHYRGNDDSLILVMRNSGGGIETAWIRENLDLIQIYEGE